MQLNTEYSQNRESKRMFIFLSWLESNRASRGLSGYDWGPISAPFYALYAYGSRGTVARDTYAHCLRDYGYAIKCDSVVRKDRYYKVCSDFAGRVHYTLPVELREEDELSFPRPLLSVLVVSLQFV